MSLPEVLAGPLLRRAEPGRVLFWLATSRPVTVHGEIVSLEPRRGGEGPRRLGWGGARRVRLGPRLFVHLVSVLPDPAVGAFPSNHLLGYDLVLGDTELDRVRELARQAGVRGPGPAVLVSATPVYGLELQERRQKFLVDKVDPYEIDFEAWHSNLAGLCDFMQLLIDELGLRSCVILSGDIHYGLNVQAAFGHNDQLVSIAQLVSSGLKHSGMLARTALHLLGAAVRPDHARVGWKTPPAVPEAGRASRLLDLLRRRAVNTDAWSEDAPVFLPPTLAERIAAEQPPCFEEARSYVRADGDHPRVVIGDNNVGLVSVPLHDGVVVHRLLARRAGRTMPQTALLPLRPPARLPTVE